MIFSYENIIQEIKMDEKKCEISLKKHYKGESLVFFRNFVAGYFIPSYDYSDLPMLINRYKEREPLEKQNGLLREVKLLKEKDDWYYIQKFVGKHGLRHLSHEQLKNMFTLIIETLESKRESLVFFRNFMEGYFIPDSDYSDLPMLINRYKEKEPLENQNGLLREIKLLKEKDDWYYVQNFVGKHGLRYLSHEQLKDMFILIIETLESKG